MGLRLYVTKQRLITSRKHHVSAVQRTADAVAAGEETAPRNPGEIVAVILLWLVYFMQEPIKQLEDEIKEGSWLCCETDAILLFDTPLDNRYDQALASFGVDPNLVWMQPVDE